MTAPPPPTSLFVTSFVSFPSPLSWVMYVFNGPILLSYHNIFSNKTVLFRKHLLLICAKNSSLESFWIFSSKISTVEFFLCTNANLPVSFPKNCLEQLFCKELVSGKWNLPLVSKNHVWSALWVHRKIFQLDAVLITQI